MTVFRLRSLSFVALLATVSACSDSAPPRPAAVVPISDVALTGTVGELVTQPLTVKVTDAGGSPVAGSSVSFAVADGGGVVSAQLDTTDFAGLASTQWRLGERVVAQRVTATVTGVGTPVSFVATARAAAPANITVSAGDNQTAAAGTAVGTSPAVLVRDRFTNPVPGVTVVFSVGGGNGTVTNAGATTNASGVATVGGWTLGATAGVNRLTATGLFSGATGNPLTFTATGTAGVAATVTAVGGSSLSGVVGGLVTPIPSVRVTDAAGNPVAGAAVVFAASTGSSVVNGARNTDANGVAAPDGWQLGAAAQNYTLTATVGALSTVFTAAARPLAASRMTIAAGQGQSTTVGNTLPIDPSVRVTDALNNPVANIDVLFEVISGGGTAVARRQTTNAQGMATVGAWDVGGAVGVNVLRASVVTTGVTVPAVEFTATALAGAPVSMAAASGAIQNATIGSAVPIVPSVVVRDGLGNPIAGISVTFSIGSGAGTITGATAVTGPTGVAAVGSWTLGVTTGTQTLVARVSGLPEVVFTANATAGVPATITAQSTLGLGSFMVATGQAAASTPSVRVTDVQGNPIPGVTVLFSLGNSNSGTITGASPVTNANGIATLGSWTLPTVAGTASVVASVTGLTGVTFTATMTPAAATQLLLFNTTVPTNPTAAGTPIAVAVRVADAFGNTVTQSGTVVSFSAQTTSLVGLAGTTSAANAATSPSGITGTVTWTLGTAVNQQLVITSPGLAGLTLTVPVIP